MQEETEKRGEKTKVGIFLLSLSSLSGSSKKKEDCDNKTILFCFYLPSLASSVSNTVRMSLKDFLEMVQEISSTLFSLLFFLVFLVFC
jgi:hypothetical protein